jgi:hypothetical protein
MKTRKELIEEICKEYGIENYTINSDWSIDVDGDVHLSNRNLTKLPLNFRNVSGNFYCSYNQLGFDYLSNEEYKLYIKQENREKLLNDLL